MLKPYGGRGGYGRADHPSHVRLSDEISVLRLLSIGFPIVFLTVGTFMTNAVLSRLLALQREQIAILKAFGFPNRQIMVHYLKFAIVMVAGGMAIGTVGCLILGRQMLSMYHRFFRFPVLEFRPEYQAFVLAIGVSVAAAILGVIHSVRTAARLPPAEAMRPAPPANYRPAWLERTGIGRFLSHTFRIAARNLQRKPGQALLTITGLALATGILIVPNCIRDGVDEVMDFQWDTIQRQTLSLGLDEPSSGKIGDELAHLPGVRAVEPVRAAFVRLSHDQRQRQLAIQGMPAVGLLNRVLGKDGHQIELPSEGLVVSSKLAEILGARVGDQLVVEVLEDKRPTFPVRLAGLADDFAGVTAYMDIHALNRLLDEGQVISGASLDIDAAYRDQFLTALKEIPHISWVAIKDSLRENFRQSTAANIGVLQSIYLSFALIVAFGVIYNNARISLAERARELATLRVIGFSRREVGGVLVTELVLLALAAVPLGLLLGTGFATGIIRSVNTETVRLPLVLTTNNYAFAVLVVVVASTISALVVLRKMNQLDLVGALKAPE
ncbi:conserved membrane hypothetical protein [Verrucomicrobia bacterium]|nr:conserved membrane hypothetical protein [Verrucomicrobiota bacterium]